MENCSDRYCLNIIVNIISFSAMNVTLNTTVNYYHDQVLNRN